MNKDLKKKALKHFTRTEGNKAGEILAKEFARLEEIFQSSDQYMVLEDALELLEVFSLRLADKAVVSLVALIHRLDTIEFQLPDEYEGYEDYFSKATIQQHAIKVLSSVRYHETDAVAAALLEFSKHSNEKVKKEALTALNELARIHLRVFEQIGAYPQTVLMGNFQRYNDDEVRVNVEAICSSLAYFLKPDLNATEWTADHVTLVQGAVPAQGGIVELRQNAIDFLIRIYDLEDSVEWKLRIIKTLNEARRDHSRGVMAPEMQNTINANSLQILDFFVSLVSKEKLQIVSVLNHDGYWAFYHARNDEIKSAALKIRDEIQKLDSYEYYRILMTQNALEGEWEEHSKGTRYLDHKLQEESIKQLAETVTQGNFPEWSERIIGYIAEAKENGVGLYNLDAFLHTVSIRLPDEVLELLDDKGEDIQDSLVAIAHGLVQSGRYEDLKERILGWVPENKFMDKLTRLFRLVEIDDQVLNSIFAQVVSENDVSALNNIVSGVFERFLKDDGEALNSYFPTAIKILAGELDPSWISNVWFSRSRDEIVATLTEESLDLALTTIVHLPNLDYQVEGILVSIAKIHPDKIFTLFERRIESKIELDETDKFTRYEPIPYEFFELAEPLSEDVPLAVSTVYQWWEKRMDPLFEFGGAKLLSIIFPTFAKEFENELSTLLTKHEENGVEFVLHVLINYTGQEFIHPICQEIVSMLPDEHRLLDKVKIVIWQAGVTTGEFGQAEALELRAALLEKWAASGQSKVRSFANDYREKLLEEAKLRHEEAEEEIRLRKHKYN